MKQRRTLALVFALGLLVLAVTWLTPSCTRLTVSGKPVTANTATVRVTRVEVSKENPSLSFRPAEPPWHIRTWHRILGILKGQPIAPPRPPAQMAPDNLVYVLVQVELTGLSLIDSPAAHTVDFRLNYGEYTIGANNRGFFSDGMSLAKAGALFLIHENDPPKVKALEVRVGDEWLSFPVNH